MTTKAELKQLLTDHVLSINFLKTDGTNRNLICTLKESIVKPFVKKTEKTKKPNDNVLSVWDLEKDAFRSFRISSIIDYCVVSEGYEL